MRNNLIRVTRDKDGVITGVEDNRPAPTTAIHIVKCEFCGQNSDAIATMGVCPACGAPSATATYINRMMGDFTHPASYDSTDAGFYFCSST